MCTLKENREINNDLEMGEMGRGSEMRIIGFAYEHVRLLTAVCSGWGKDWIY